MRVLVVHNRYSSAVPSGENAVVDSEVRWLREASVEVDRFEVNNDDVLAASRPARLTAGLEAVWNRRRASALTEQIDRVGPDVVHLHNVFPLLSPSVLSVALRTTSVVWTVHNYRIACIAGTFNRDGSPCTACLPTRRLAGIRYGCFAGSAAASAAVTVATSTFSRIARSGVVAAPVSAHVGRWLIGRGFDPARVMIKHNGVDDPGVTGNVSPGSSKRLLFVGRLAPEKGIRELLAAWRGLPGAQWSLVVAGGGELQGEVAAAAVTDPRIVPLGAVSAARVVELMNEARAVVIPSQWEEPFPRTAVEALAVGRPLITSGLGGLAELVDRASGWAAGPSVDGLRGALVAVTTADAASLDARGARARQRFETSFTPEVTTAALLSVYDRAISSRNVLRS